MAICCALHTFRVRLPPLATNGLIGINSIISGMRARGRREHRERDEEASDASSRPSRHNARGRASGFSPCAGRGNLLESHVERALVGEADGRREALTTAALVPPVAQETRLTHHQTAAMVERFLAGSIEALSTGETGALHGCGRCRCGQRWARQGRHPTTGVPVEGPAHTVPVLTGGRRSTSGCTLGGPRRPHGRGRPACDCGEPGANAAPPLRAMTSPSATTRARTPPHAMAQTSGQEEAMADPRQVERLVQHVQRLPQRDEYWVGTHRLARLWVTPRTAPPYRPYLTLVLSQEGKIVRSQVQRHPPTAETLFEDLLQAMRRPVWGAGRARRPTRLYVDHPEDVAALTPWLAALQVQCVYRHPLALADAVIADMERRLGLAKPRPGLLSIPSVTPPLLGHLYQLAAQWYQATPWRWLNDHHPFAICCLPEDSPRYAVVMGSGGEGFCLAGYETLADLQLMFTSP